MAGYGVTKMVDNEVSIEYVMHVISIMQLECIALTGGIPSLFELLSCGLPRFLEPFMYIKKACILDSSALSFQRTNPALAGIQKFSFST